MPSFTRYAALRGVELAAERNLCGPQVVSRATAIVLILVVLVLPLLAFTLKVLRPSHN